jgi:hypothetical protein
MEASEVKSVRLPVFDGITAKFQIWWVHLMAYATVYKFSKALKIGGKSAMTGLKDADAIADETIKPRKLQAAAKKRNAVAMANLMMAFASEMTMGLVLKAMTL